MGFFEARAAVARTHQSVSGCLPGCWQQDYQQGDDAMEFGDNLSDEENDLGYGVPAGQLQARVCSTRYVPK